MFVWSDSNDRAGPGYLPPTSHYPLPATCHLPANLPPTTCHLPTHLGTTKHTYHLLPATFYLLPTIRTQTEALVLRHKGEKTPPEPSQMVLCVEEKTRLFMNAISEPLTTMLGKEAQQDEHHYLYNLFLLPEQPPVTPCGPLAKSSSGPK